MKWKASWKSDVRPEGKTIYVECDEKFDEKDIRDVVRWRYCLSKRVIITVEKVKDAKGQEGGEL